MEPVFNNVWEQSLAKNTYPVTDPVAMKIFKKPEDNRLIDHIKKFSLFSDFEYCFKSSNLTVDLLSFLFDGIFYGF